MLKTPPKAPIRLQITMEAECKTPPPIQQNRDENVLNSSNELQKSVTPDFLRLLSAFKYPERYTSPTDLMVSPVTKGLLILKGRKGGALLPSGKNQLKMLDLRAKEEGILQNKAPMLIDEKLNSK